MPRLQETGLRLGADVPKLRSTDHGRPRSSGRRVFSEVPQHRVHGRISLVRMLGNSHHIYRVVDLVTYNKSLQQTLCCDREWPRSCQSRINDGELAG